MSKRLQQLQVLIILLIVSSGSTADLSGDPLAAAGHEGGGLEEWSDYTPPTETTATYVPKRIAIGGVHSSPPASIDPGIRVIVGTSPEGAFEDQSNMFARSQDGGLTWIFEQPVIGSLVYDPGTPLGTAGYKDGHYVFVGPSTPSMPFGAVWPDAQWVHLASQSPVPRASSFEILADSVIDHRHHGGLVETLHSGGLLTLTLADGSPFGGEPYRGAGLSLSFVNSSATGVARIVRENGGPFGSGSDVREVLLAPGETLMLRSGFDGVYHAFGQQGCVLAPLCEGSNDPSACTSLCECVVSCQYPPAGGVCRQIDAACP